MKGDPNSTTTRLLTLLNVSALKAGKRKRAPFDVENEAPPPKAAKLNKRHSARFDIEKGQEHTSGPVEQETLGNTTSDSATADALIETEKELEEDAGADDPYEAHFGSDPSSLTEAARKSVDEKKWTKADSQRLSKAWHSAELVPEQSADTPPSAQSHIIERLRKPFEERQAERSKEQTKYQPDILHALASNRDLYVTSTPLDNHKDLRESISLHALNHITKKRRRVLKNNQRIAAAAKSSSPAPEDVLDQGFTRPSVLLLLPFRSSALAWLDAITSHTPSPPYQIENRARFRAEYGLPEGAVDKLAMAEPGEWPRDHVETFKGNVDDAFRVGVKVSKKSVKCFAEFYASDIIMASPLGLRMAIEKERNADFLSSIEVLVVDQMDVLAMQNWEHVQFVMANLNNLPKESHNTDFSRVMPWYLDGHAAYLRQSILLAAYETPEARALFSNSLKNVAGKMRTSTPHAPVKVPAGVAQNFIMCECSSPQDEADKRFECFATQLLPSVLKSAVQSTRTVVFVPSSFDFLRVQNHFKTTGVTYAVLSEYSSNQDIGRARQAFFAGKKSFLLVSERFHFFRRYKIRGMRNVVFYGPPAHAQFYSEFLSYPFLDDGVESSDVTSRVLYTKFDWFALERIAGTKGARELIHSA